MKAIVTLFLMLSLIKATPYTYLFETKLDHTTAAGADNSPTFSIRYIVDD
jgi:hypothetical protein